MINKNFKSYKNICYTNNKRKEINNNCMVEYLKNYNGKTFDVKALEYDKNTQNYILAEGMPLISRVNMKSIDVLNNEIFKCDKIEKDIIKVSNFMKKLVISKDVFHKIFLLQFCITTHKSQGIDLKEKYCIHEFLKFDKKLRYVSISRATEFDNINIVISEEEKRIDEIHKLKIKMGFI